ncbi:MAG TPA: Rne/Rng family ribonuclease [Candidatus Acidoferrum sp.]|nr:Rne/Rng family ribonuclease [Candidatus Acidoferrum sp.]
MSKELVISAASHERRVAILEEGQLVEIYIEREKEFALVGSIYKGKVTRVLPGMQSAFVDIGLDGDAFLYVSDVFENLEDYDHDHVHDMPHAAAIETESHPAAAIEHEPESHSVELLPGESLAKAGASQSGASDGQDNSILEVTDEPRRSQNAQASEHEGQHEELSEEPQPGNAHEAPEPEDRQPDSNASAPQNFGPNYKSSQNYSPRGASGPGQNFGRGNDRGNDRGQDSGSNRGGGRFGRRGGRRRGGRPGGPGGRNLPPSKYASPQGSQSNDTRGDSRGHDPRSQGQNRGAQPRGFEPRGAAQRGFDNRRPETPRQSGPSPAAPNFDAAEEPILLPGESLAKYRGKPIAAPASPVVEQESSNKTSDATENSRPASLAASPSQPAAALGGVVPRRFTGGLPRWLLADAGAESEAAPVSADENIGVGDDSTLSAHGNNPPRHEASPLELPTSGSADLDDDQIAALGSGLVEAKQEEVQEVPQVAALTGDAIFEEEEEVEEAEEVEEDQAENEAEESHAEVSELTDDETAEVEEGRAASRAEAEADAAHESAEHHAALGLHEEEHAAGAEHHEGHHEGTHGQEETERADAANVSVDNLVSATAAAHIAEDDIILLPGETRAPRSAAGASAPREEFPRDSARVGGNPRQRFQRPFRSGGRDRGRDNRGGRPDSRGGRPDNRGGRPERSGRPGQRFERRPSGPGGPRHDRGHQGGHHPGSSRRPQLISEMLKAGQDVVIQIAKEPLGKKGARITSHVALPGRFLVYMPTIDHIGVSRKIASADNRSRLRRLVGEARGSYPGGFIVRTAAGGATDEEIRADIEFLGTTWNEIKERSEQRKAPSLLHRDLNLVERILRDYVSDDFTAIWIDSEEEFSKVVEFVSRFQPKLVSRVKLYTKETPIFEEFGIQHELDKALRAKVWLKSGGYIVINHTEALVAIDVNTGKFVGKGSTRLEDTIVKTNLEAVKEIVRQIRLRDLGGIIVVDFIDMEERRNRDKVLFALQQALEEDKAPSKALSFNEFGLVCITRKRTKQALERVLCQPCPYCTGSGMVKSIPTLCYEIQAEARKMAMAGHEGPNLTLRVHPEIAKALKTRESLLMDELEQTSHKHIIIQSDATLHWEQYDIY